MTDRKCSKCRAIAQTATALVCAACGAILPGQHIQVQPASSAGIVRYMPFEQAEGSDGGYHLPESTHRTNLPSAEYGGTVSVDTAVTVEPPHLACGSVSSASYGYY